MNNRILDIASTLILFIGIGCLPSCAQQELSVDIVSLANDIIKSGNWELANSVMMRYGLRAGELAFATDYKFYEVQRDSAWYVAQVYPLKGDKRRIEKIKFISNHNASAVVNSLLRHGYKYEEYHPVMASASGWYSRDSVEVNFELFPKGGPRYEVTFYLNGLSSK